LAWAVRVQRGPVRAVADLRLATSDLEDLANPVVVDSQAYGRLYAGPVSLQRFEENAGASNSSLLRCEGNAVFAVERSTAAVRIT
jgi:hypothetical protein